MSVSARVCGKTPSSRPVRNTIGNSRPLAACIVISVTNDASGSSVSRSLTSAMFARKSSSEPAVLRIRLRTRGRRRSALAGSRCGARPSLVSSALQLAQVARLFHHRDQQVGDRERLGLLAQVVDQLGEALELALLLRHGALEQSRIEHGLADRDARGVRGIERARSASAGRSKRRGTLTMRRNATASDGFTM